jgi:short subunit dehydrogenase/uncharacterized protein DUF2255
MADYWRQQHSGEKVADALIEMPGTIERFGRWDILVNNAGIALVKPFGQVTEEEFDASFQVNVKGCFNGCQLALERMGDGGRIILPATRAVSRRTRPSRCCRCRRRWSSSRCGALRNDLNARHDLRSPQPQVCRGRCTRCGGVEMDVRFVETANEATNKAVDKEYLAKYGRYDARYVDSMVAAGARSTTIKLVPARDGAGE